MKSCAHCGRKLPTLEGSIGRDWICHPDDPHLLDCYRLITVYHEKMGSRMPKFDMNRRVENINGKAMELADMMRREGLRKLSITTDELGVSISYEQEGHTPCMCKSASPGFACRRNAMRGQALCDECKEFCYQGSVPGRLP